jgi:hypothetical protein
LQLVRFFQTVDVEVLYGVLLLAAINTPFQGLPNFFVYLYPKFMRIKPELGFWGRVRKSMATRESKNRVDDSIEQGLQIHEEGEEPATGDIIRNTLYSASSIPISSEDNIELIGNPDNDEKGKSSEAETNGPSNEIKKKARF